MQQGVSLKNGVWVVHVVFICGGILSESHFTLKPIESQVKMRQLPLANIQMEYRWGWTISDRHISRLENKLTQSSFRQARQSPPNVQPTQPYANHSIRCSEVAGGTGNQQGWLQHQYHNSVARNPECNDVHLRQCRSSCALMDRPENSRRLRSQS